MATPPPQVLKSQLLAFKSKWKDISYSGKNILPTAAVNEIQSLLVRIQRGCLSGITPGRSTNQNERLHRNLNSHMSCCKYGLEFAYALLTSAFFRHNKHISANVENRQAKPIIAYTNVDVSDYKETLGVTVNTKEDKTIHLQEQTQSH